MQDFKSAQSIEVAGTTYSDEFDYSDSENITNVEALLDVTALSGSGATLNVTPQITYNGGETWIDGATAFDEFVATGQQVLKLVTLGIKMRFKFVVAGTTPSLDFSVFAVAR